MSEETKKQYSYSRGGDDFTGKFDSIEEARDQGFEDEEEARSIYVGEVIPLKIEDLIKPRRIVEDIQEQAWDVAGDVAEDYLDSLCSGKDKEGLEALRSVVADFLRERHPINFWGIGKTWKLERPQE